MTPLFLGYFTRSVYDSLAEIRACQYEPSMLEQRFNLRVLIVAHTRSARVSIKPGISHTDRACSTLWIPHLIVPAASCGELLDSKNWPEQAMCQSSKQLNLHSSCRIT